MFEKLLTYCEYDMFSAIVEVSLPQAAYLDIHQIGVNTDFFKQNHILGKIMQKILGL